MSNEVHHITGERSPHNGHVMLRCTECDDIIDCGAVYDELTTERAYQNARLFRMIHARGNPKFPANAEYVAVPGRNPRTVRVTYVPAKPSETQSPTVVVASCVPKED